MKIVFSIFPVFSSVQAALRTFLSVRLSVRLSVKPFSQCSSHRIIMEFSGVITTDKSDARAKCRGQKSKVKVIEVKTILTILGCFWTVSPI